MQTLSSERIGRFTASAGLKLYKGGATADSYIAEKAEELVTGRQKLFSSKDTEHGLMYEYDGLEAFTKVTGLLTEHCDQHFYKINENSGATPDAKVIDFSDKVLASIDIKCPTKSFFKQKLMMINEKKPQFQNVPEEYFIQGQIQMLAMSTVLGYEVGKHYLVRYLTSTEIDDDGNKHEIDLPLESRIFYKIIYKDAFIQKEWLRKVENAVRERDKLVQIFKKPII